MSRVKTTVLAVLILACMIPSFAQANTITLTVGAGGVAGDHILGEIFTRKDFGQTGGQSAVDVLAINGLLDVALGTRTGVDPEYWRSITNFGVLPDATIVGASPRDDRTTFVLDQVYLYLVVSYDGQHGGSQAYYIGDLNIGDTIKIVQNAYPDGVAKNVGCGGLTKKGLNQPDCGHLKAGTYYGVTHSTFLNPVERKVPDGGMTISLLGMAMAGMGLVARRMTK